MPRLPRVSGRKVLAALTRAGFELIRMSGDHAYLVNRETGKRTVVAVSASTVPPGTLASILRQAGLTTEQFQRFL